MEQQTGERRERSLAVAGLHCEKAKSLLHAPADGSPIAAGSAQSRRPAHQERR